jgi:hypothetical protein
MDFIKSAISNAGNSSNNNNNNDNNNNQGGDNQNNQGGDNNQNNQGGDNNNQNNQDYVDKGEYRLDFPQSSSIACRARAYQLT